MKKIFAFILSTCLCASFVSATNYQQREIFDSSKAAIECISNGQYEILLNSFTDQNNVISYPEYYAGAYLDTNGYLVVSVTDDSPAIMAQVQTITGNPNIIIEKKEHSYNDLLSIKDSVINYYRNNYTANVATADITKVSILDDKNEVHVGLSSLSHASVISIAQGAFGTNTKSAGNSERPVVFVETPEFASAASLYAGDGITSPLGVLSIGFPCTRYNGVTTQYGFVTAAHGASTGNSISHGGTAIGKVTASKYSGTVDTAFVNVTNSSYPISMSINAGGSILSITGKTVTAVNSTVYKDGATTGFTSGKVLSTSSTITIGGHVVSDCVETTCNGAGGDSGGIFFTRPTSTTAYVLGTLQSVGTTDSGNVQSVYIKVYNILGDTSLGISFPSLPN
ncbi:MAG: S1 family peptidase [Christensenellaceae bacterium]